MQDPTIAPTLSLIIPAYNEVKRLPASLRDVRSFFSKWPESSIEVLVMIETSSDGTLDAARTAVSGDSRFKIIDNVVHRGKGYAVKSGMLRARGEMVRRTLEGTLHASEREAEQRSIGGKGVALLQRGQP